MIEWQEHSTLEERLRMSAELFAAEVEMYDARRAVVVAAAKLGRQKKPSNVEKATAELDLCQQRTKTAKAVHDEKVRVMCHVHVDINLDDIVELVDAEGQRKRAPIVVEAVEFNRNTDGSFWLRIQGVLLEESSSGRPQIRQGFDLQELDASTRLVKHN